MVGSGVQVLAERGCTQVAVDSGGIPDAAAEGAHLAAWRYIWALSLTFLSNGYSFLLDLQFGAYYFKNTLYNTNT